MNSKVVDVANQLAKEILESEEYTSFQKARELVAKDGLGTEIKQFRNELFHLQARGPEAYRSQIGELTSRHRDLIACESVKQYLDAEIKVCRLVQYVTNLITDDLEMDLDFLE